MIVRSAVIALPILSIGPALAGATGLLAYGVLYPVVAAKWGWRVHARLARALAILSMVVGLLIGMKLALLLSRAHPAAGLALCLVHLVASVLLCVGVFRYTAAHAFVTKRPRSESRSWAKTHWMMRALGIAFAAALGVYTFADALSGSSAVEMIRDIGAAPAASHSVPGAAPPVTIPPTAAPPSPPE